MQQISTSYDVYTCLQSDFNPVAEEVWILALDCQLRVISKYMLFRGTVDHCLIHPRDIFRWVIIHNSTAFILAHNHPSRDARPSDKDLQFTAKLYKLSRTLEIPLYDHIIFTADKYFSMADQGVLHKTRKKNQRMGSPPDSPKS